MRGFVILFVLSSFFLGCSDMMSGYNFREDKFNISIVINNGDRFCYVQQVNLRLSFENIESVRFSEDGGTWSEWMSPQNNFPWTFSYKTGERRIYCEARTIYGEIMTSFDSIIYYDRVSSVFSTANISSYTFDASANLNFIVSGTFVPSVYRRVTDSWTEEKAVAAPAADALSNFNSISVSNDGSMFIVGYPFYDDNKGVAYLYEKVSDNWNIKKTFSGTQTGDRFGISVKISGDSNKLIIGACGANDGSPLGYLKLYGKNEGGAGNWGELTQIISPVIKDLPTDIYGQFAASLDCNHDGRVIIVGEPDFCYTGMLSNVYAGKVYLYIDSGMGYSGYVLGNPIGRVPEGKYGFSVSCDSAGTHAAVGAPGEARTFLFDLSDNGYNSYTELSVTGLSNDANFGASVDIVTDSNETFVAVSAYEKTSSRGTRTGAVYLFNETETLLKTTELQDSSGGDLFGRKVVLGTTGKSFAASVPGDDIFTQSDNQGSVYVFRDVIE